MEKPNNTRQSGSAATLTGRGAGSVGQRYDVAILLPDPSQLQDPQVVPSHAMMERKRKVARRFGGSAGYRIWQPSQDPREVFRALGITVEDSSTAHRLRSQVNGAVARKLENLGGYIVTWPRGDNRLPFLRDTFRADFTVARDYRMFQAGQPDDGDGPGEPERNPWPETSGIGTARNTGG